MIEKFEDIVAWQKAKDLSISIYSQFKECKDFGFRDQICRATVSVMNNIAEGFERQTKKEFKHYLFIAKGSSGEVRSMLHLASELNYIENNTYEVLLNDSTEISTFLKQVLSSGNEADVFTKHPSAVSKTRTNISSSVSGKSPISQNGHVGSDQILSPLMIE